MHRQGLQTLSCMRRHEVTDIYQTDQEIRR